MVNDTTTETAQGAAQFIVGKTYTCRSICDSECVYSFTILKRTKTMVSFMCHGDMTSRKIRVDEYGVEWVFPHGNYSMAPVLRAK